MVEFEFDFRPRRIDGPAGVAVEQIWYARGTVPYRTELIAPTGSTVALLVFGDPIRQAPIDGDPVTSSEGLMIGPHTAPIENAPLGETFALGIVTTSVGCEAALGVRPGEIRGRVVELATVSAGLTALRETLVTTTADPESMLDALRDEIEASVDTDIPGLERTARAVAMVEQDPRRPIADVAATLEVTHAHLDREFGRIVGLSPRALARLLLLRRILESLEPTKDVSWVDLAYENGWSDQAHFSRDFKRHTGVTPGRYLAIQRAIAGAGGGDGAGFTPDLDDLR